MSTPTNRAGRRRYRKSRDRRVWVFSELNHDLRPEQIAKILVSGGLEQARREAEARAEKEARLLADAEPKTEGEEASDA
ncbi:hypothetical protein [Microbacterium sp.]|uniref:hypothetical protein n=1 Tax=Microbacterium sp. TaxID=51671 RepID=UPI0039E297C1